MFISGKVQGVCYRIYLKKKAEENKVVGWVRNLRDGRVEAVLEGEDCDVEEVLKWCRRGPPAAKVEEVEVLSEPSSEKLSGFSIR